MKFFKLNYLINLINHLLNFFIYLNVLNLKLNIDLIDKIILTLIRILLVQTLII